VVLGKYGTKLNVANKIHKLYNIQARLFGKTEFKRINNILDDTGSEYLELYEQDDCAKLGLVQDDDYEG